MKLLARLGKLCEELATWLTIASVGIMALTVFAQVVMRYFFLDPLVWGDELAKYSLAFMTFIGASVALRKGELACMDLLAVKFSPSAQRIIAICVMLLNIALIIFLLLCSFNLVSQNSVRTQVSPAMEIPMQYVYLCLPVGLSLMALQAFLCLIDLSTGRKTDGGGS
jgi:TRAP-type C4-dicarboxylate transport system permease small subunit